MPASYPKTDILLPYKEVMTHANAGAVSRVVANLYRHSKHQNALTIFGTPISDPPLEGVNFHPLPIHRPWLYGKNRGFLKAYLAHLKSNPEMTPELVEIHGRCHLARELKTARPELAVSLYLHNDARMMRGGKTIQERLWLAENLSALIFVSDYLRKVFTQDLPKDRVTPDILAKCMLIPNEVTRTARARPAKKKTIILAGRMVPEKGILEACKAAAHLLPRFPDWQLHVVGGQHFYSSKPSEYEQLIAQALMPIKAQSTQHGFLNGAELARLQSEASIALVPSLWQEPAGLTVMEALAHGCALITTDKGGIPEIATGRAEILPIRQLDYKNPAHHADITSLIAQKLDHLLSHPSLIALLQDKAWSDFPYHAKNMAVNADRYRFSLKS